MSLGYEDLFPGQVEIVDRYKSESSMANLSDMGTGKTPMTICTIKDKWLQAGGIVDTIIFCPVIVLENWKDEFLAWTKLDKKHIGVVRGTAKKRLQIIENTDHKIIVINYEALRTDAVVKALVARKFKIAVADESQKIKTYKSIACRKVLQITKTASVFKVMLSGTPISGLITDIWSQFLFLDGGETFGYRMSVFKSKYMVQYIPYGTKYPKWRVDPNKIDEFNKLLYSRACRLENTQGLPELRSIPMKVELSSEQKKHYKEVQKELITWLDEQEDNPLVVTNALTKMLRLNEISSGFMKLYDGTIHKFKTNPRLDACMELVEQSAPHKVIIFAIFKQNYKDIREALEKRGIEYVEITGEVSTDEKLAAAKSFKTTDAGPRIALCNTRSAGLGVNLTGARYKIYYTRNFSLDDYLQSVKRNHREGAQKYHDNLTDYHLIAPDTIDEVIYKRILSKEKFVNKLLDIRSLLL